MTSAAGFEDIARAVKRRFGEQARIDNIAVPTLGGSNRTVIFDLMEGASKRRVVSRQETYTAANSPFLSTAEQFRAMRVAFDHDVPVPEPLFEYDDGDALGNGFVTAFIGGETMPKRIQTGAAFDAVRPRLIGQLAETIAKLHAVPLERFGFLETVPDSLDPVTAQRDRYDSYEEQRPAVELGLRWLENHRPPPTPSKPLHGDFRLGNFMVDERDGIVALLDWECAHLGSVTEDLGWLTTRSWRFGRPDLGAAGLASRAALLDAYAAAGGARIEAEELRYWEIFGLVKWAIFNMMQVYGHRSGARRGLVFAACGRNTALVEYDLLMTLAGHYD